MFCSKNRMNIRFEKVYEVIWVAVRLLFSVIHLLLEKNRRNLDTYFNIS